MSYNYPPLTLLENRENGLKRGILCPQFENRRKNSLTFALGTDENGDPVCPDLSRLPHLAVAGTTGSGKSVLLYSMLVSFFYAYSPDELKLQIVVPEYKAYAFKAFENIPYRWSYLASNGKDVEEVLIQAVTEMERRYSLFSEAIKSGIFAKNIAEYNEAFPDSPLPRIVLVIDEFNEFDRDLRKTMERYIIRLVQKSRACGIHLVILSESAKSDNITGVMLANLPARACLKVESRYDSQRMVLMSGAESITTAGECYFYSPEQIQASKVKCYFVTYDEVTAVCNYLRENI